MYLRETSRVNRDGTKVTYLQFAENVWDPIRKRSQTKIIYNFGRAAPELRARLRELAKSILRRTDPEMVIAENPSWKLLDSWPYGDLYVLGSLWDCLGIRRILKEKLKEAGREVPLERAIFAMVANRCLAPASKLYCYEQWLREDVYFPEGIEIELHHLYQAMDFLEQHKEGVEKEIYFSVADLLNADVELVFYDTTSLHFEADEEDDPECEPYGKRQPALRKRGHSKSGRSDAPQVVVGLAMTRDGLPVRSWVFPGNTVDVTTVKKVKEDLRGWRLNRCVFVGDAGMVSEDNLRELSLGGGRYILCMPMRRGDEVTKEVLTRPGRYQGIKENLRVKEVWVPSPSAGERRRRYVVCYNPFEAERQKSHRRKVLKELEAEMESLRSGPQKDSSKRVVELLTSRRYGSYLRRDKRGEIAIDLGKVELEERCDGKFVLTTNDDTLTREDMALGYKQLQQVEGMWRKLKSGIRIRPVYHWSPHRIVSHVTLCVLSLLLERVAERECQDTWRNIRDDLKKLKVAQFLTPNGGLVQTSELRTETLNRLKLLKIKPPPVILKAK